MDAWQALADPSRRLILTLLAGRDMSAGEIAEHFSSTRSAVSQHLAVLRAAGLVEVASHGRRRIYSLDGAAMARVRADIQSFWDVELAALAREAASMTDDLRTEHDERSAG